MVASTEINTHRVISAYLRPVILAPPNSCANARTKIMPLMAASIYPALIPGFSILGYKMNKNGMTYVTAPNMTERLATRPHYAHAIPAATNTPTHTGGVITDNVA